MQSVLDASALLAYLQEEKGSELIDTILSQSVMSSVNWAEVIQKAIAKQVDTRGMQDELEMLGLVIQPFTVTQAELAAELWLKTKEHGLSLGDRACLSLAIDLNAPVYTTDKIWTLLNLPITVHYIR
jgi:ribonuclease VapC